MGLVSRFSSTCYFQSPHIFYNSIFRGCLSAIFPHILYCSPSKLSSDQLHKLHVYNLSFNYYGETPLHHNHGSFNYRCVHLAVQMGYRVQGAIVMADDVLFMARDIKYLNQNKVWYLKFIRTADLRLQDCQTKSCPIALRWWLWHVYWKYAQALVKDLQLKQKVSPTVHRCYSHLTKRNGAKLIHAARSDFYYIPSSIVKEFGELAQLFVECRIFLEIAVATILQCWSNRNQRETMNDLYLYGSGRKNLLPHINKVKKTHNGFLHPIK